MWKYWLLLTDLPGREIEGMQSAVMLGKLHPMQAKKNLAWGIVRDFHSAEAAEAAAESWAKVVQQRGVAEDVPVVEVSAAAEGLVQEDGAVRLPKLLHAAGLAASAGEATRKLAEHAVSVNAEKFSERVIGRAELGESPVLRLGKKSVRVKWVE
jgi:tyrosyl-tRNA synthetase